MTQPCSYVARVKGFPAHLQATKTVKAKSSYTNSIPETFAQTSRASDPVGPTPTPNTNASMSIQNSFVPMAFTPGYHGPWGCHAFQRRSSLRPLDDHCGVPNCRQLHRPGFQHCELVAFRDWAAHVHEDSWFTVWTSTPDIQGQAPLSLIHYSTL